MAKKLYKRPHSNAFPWTFTTSDTKELSPSRICTSCRASIPAFYLICINSLCGNPTLASVPTAGRLPDKSVLAEVHFDSLLTSRQTLNTQREEMKREAGKLNNFTYWSKDGCDKGRSGPKLDPRLGSFSVQLVLPSATGAGPAALQPRAANTRKPGHGEKRLQSHSTGPVYCNCCPLEYSTITFKPMGKKSKQPCTQLPKSEMHLY